VCVLKCLNPENVLNRDLLHAGLDLGVHELLGAVGMLEKAAKDSYQFEFPWLRCSEILF
jgi:hypothetical protein